ncbi:Gfo/Idh/MocA family oxidoreductase [Candidatus Villigracilis affinis]|uniref:Gfo/Idh/MocA family protein n=1 Tax=Candidatus Villigracilis affinis TaxID=3140682 RepID=UPI001D3B5DBA|nr:Gfo/Idh/MocA family oxidoreductase [Anaerolineales bacterium]
MSLNPVIDMLGRRLRLAVIGGGTGSFIGAMHRQSARRDDRYQIVTGIFSSDQAKSKKDASELGFESDRMYHDAKALLDGEASRKDGIDAVAIMTPNDSHFDYSMWALERGIDVICDKPMTNTLAEAEALHKKVQETGLVFCLTHNYTGYPMVRQAKAMVEAGDLGTIRLVQVEYVQGGKADEEKTFSPDNWKFDPVRGGPSRVMGDIGTHAHNLTRFITGLEVDEVAAEVGAIVPKRIIHDFGGAMLRFSNGARGSFWVTQAAAGVENCLRIRVSGTKGSLEWMQEFPQALTFKPLKAPSQNRTPNGPGTLPLSARCTRLVAGHPEGFPDGFANIYSDAAEAIAARRAGKKADPLALYFPNSFDGLMGVRFVDSVIASSEANGQWTKC